MTSKQLADAVLTTADNSTNQRFIPPTYTITMEETQTSPTLTTERIIVYYINKPVSTNVQADLEGYYAKNSVALKKYYSINSLEDFLSVYAGTYATMPRFETTLGSVATSGPVGAWTLVSADAVSTLWDGPLTCVNS